MHISHVADGGPSKSYIYNHSVKDMLAQQASFETTSRLLSALVNEGLVRGIVTRPGPNGLSLQIQCPEPAQKQSNLTILVGLAEGISYDSKAMTLPSLLHPDDLRLPVMVVQGDSLGKFRQSEVNPGVLFNRMYPWFGKDESARTKIVNELDNSARNQGRLRIWQPDRLSIRYRANYK